MSSPEAFGSDRERCESQPNTYVVASRFRDELTAVGVYRVLQATIFDAKCDLSVYRFTLDSAWHVAALGDSPPSDIDMTIRDQLGQGEVTALADEVQGALVRRRARAKRIGPWVERHYR